MKEYFDCLIMTHGTAFGVGAAIFLLTILLVAKRVIGFVLSVILMLIALGASWAINNEAYVRGHLQKWIPTTQTSVPASSEASRTVAPTSSMERVERSTNSVQPTGDVVGSENLRGQVDQEKSRVQDFLEEKHPTINPQK